MCCGDTDSALRLIPWVSSIQQECPSASPRCPCQCWSFQRTEKGKILKKIAKIKESVLTASLYPAIYRESWNPIVFSFLILLKRKDSYILEKRLSDSYTKRKEGGREERGARCGFDVWDGPERLPEAGGLETGENNSATSMWLMNQILFIKNNYF